MAVDLPSKTVAELETILRNHETAGKTNAPSFKAALAELGARKTASLSLDRTVEIIGEAARRRQFIPYRQVAEQNGVEWSKANVAMRKHLLAVCEYGHRKGLPMLSAIVVSQNHVADGGMDEPTLTGFCKAARALKLEVADPAAFLKQQQAEVFTAAAEGRF